MVVDIIQHVTSDVEYLSTQTPMQEIDDAYKACKFGRFHYRLISTTLVGCIAGALVTNTTTYILPVAECDLDMNLLDKGMLNAAPFCGMLASSVLAGFLTDTFGRKIFLQVGYGGVFIFSVIAGSSQTYKVLLAAKFMEGVFIGCALSAYVTFLSEFCHKKIRDRVMICQASFVATSQVICPLMSWAILTQDWKYSMFSGYFVLNTWNFYLYIMSLWSFIACLFYSTLPESPKYLVAQHKYEKARNILMKIYRENTGKSDESYPYIDIWKSIEKQEIQLQSDSPHSMTHQIISSLRKVRPIFHRPQACNLAILSCIMFTILTIYNILRLWFPQLSSIVENYGMGADQDLCTYLDNYISDLKARGDTMSNSTGICVPAKSGAETYINSTIIGLACLTPYLVTGAVVNKFGKKALLILCGVICTGATLGLRWANSKFAFVALFAVNTAISQLMKGLNQATAVELFPTEIRSLAVSIVLLAGRLATLTGNIGFPILLDIGCAVPFFAMAGMMLCCSVLALFMPKKQL